MGRCTGRGAHPPGSLPAGRAVKPAGESYVFSLQGVLDVEDFQIKSGRR